MKGSFAYLDGCINIFAAFGQLQDMAVDLGT